MLLATDTRIYVDGKLLWQVRKVSIHIAYLGDPLIKATIVHGTPADELHVVVDRIVKKAFLEVHCYVPTDLAA